MVILASQPHPANARRCDYQGSPRGTIRGRKGAIQAGAWQCEIQMRVKEQATFLPWPGARRAVGVDKPGHGT